MDLGLGTSGELPLPLVQQLAFFNGTLFATGQFQHDGHGAALNNFAKWTGTAWAAVLGLAALAVTVLGWVSFAILLVPVVVLSSRLEWPSEQARSFWRDFPVNYPRFWHWLTNPLVSSL